MPHYRPHRIVASAGGRPIGKAAGLRRKVPTIILACIVVLLYVFIVCERNMSYYDCAAAEKPLILCFIRLGEVPARRGGQYRR